MKCIRNIFPMLIAISLICVAQSSVAQNGESIELVNQDGEKLNTNHLKIQLQVDGQGKANTGDGKKITANDGSITIVNEDGTTREIDVMGARSIMMNKSVQSIMKNGEKKTRVQGKAILIGPDGERQEFDLAEGEMPEILRGQLDMVPLKRGMFKAFGNKPVFRFWSDPNMTWSGGKYIVGVHCRPVSEVLAAQLGLGENIGLVVLKVTPDSPAAAAGLQPNDILMYAGQTALGNTEHLVKVVQKAGADNAAVSFSVIRRTKEINIDVTPTERQKVQPGGIEFVNPGDQGPGIFQLDEFGPGMIFEAEGFGGALNKNFHKQMEDMHRMMQEQVKRMNQLQKRFDNFQNDDN